MSEEQQTAVVKWNEPVRTVPVFGAALESVSDKVTALLPPDVSPQQFLQVCRNVVSRNPDLLKCRAKDLIDVCMRLAELGLYAGGTMPEAHVVVFNNTETDERGRDVRVPTPTVIPDYRGLAKLAVQHPNVLAVHAQLVCEGDDFSYEQGTTPRIEHKPNWQGSRKNIIGAYAVGWLRGDRAVVEVMNHEELELVRSKSKAKDSPAWRQFAGEMYRKTVFRRLSKWLPRSNRLRMAVEMLDQVEGLRDAQAAPDALSASEAVDDALGKGEGASAPPRALEAATEQPADPHKGEVKDEEIPT